ncbi:cytosolic factor, phosphatidylinositol/phosphatidylcholine transfer protein [Blyttiomyces sp. JEL0837]|nr:cytosolic factor, phosphatidylinositol/phosphatidylcholine transfer protein [Blyttiomyces sp. JEL0837]
MSSVSPDQQASLDRLKEALTASGFYKPGIHTDALLLRFLRARKFDHDKTKLMFENCETWRKEFNVDNVISTFTFPEFSEVKKIYPRFYHKTDKMGRPIYFEILGNLDTKKLFMITTSERLVTAYVREYEKTIRYRLPACSQYAKKPLEQGTTILDLKSVPLTQFNNVRKIIQQVSKIAQDYYPETLGRMFLINAPTLFTTVWTVVKPMLDENTVAKISVLGSSYQKALLECIDEGCLPVEYGGKCQCPGGCLNSDLGPWNDGSVAGYPKPEWEGFAKRDADAAVAIGNSISGS